MKSPSRARSMYHIRAMCRIILSSLRQLVSFLFLSLYSLTFQGQISKTPSYTKIIAGKKIDLSRRTYFIKTYLFYQDVRVKAYLFRANVSFSILRFLYLYPLTFQGKCRKMFIRRRA